MEQHTHKTTHHREGFDCPFCREHFDASTSITGNTGPKKDDLTLCIACGEICVFDVKPLRLRKPTEEEYSLIAADSTISSARAAWLEADKAKSKTETDPEFNKFPPFSIDFGLAMKAYIRGEPREDAMISWRLFFYCGALAATMRMPLLKGSYADFMMAAKAFMKELEGELATVEKDGTAMGIYVDEPESTH